MRLFLWVLKTRKRLNPMILIRQAESDDLWYFIHTDRNDPGKIPTLLFNRGAIRIRAKAILKELQARGLTDDLTLQGIRNNWIPLRIANLAVIHNVKTARTKEFFDYMDKKGNVFAFNKLERFGDAYLPKSEAQP